MNETRIASGFQLHPHETTPQNIVMSHSEIGSGTSNYSFASNSTDVAETFFCPLKHADMKMTVPLTTFSICVFGNFIAIIFLWKSNQRSDNKQHIFYTLVMTLACCDFVSSILTSPITFTVYMTRKCVIEIGGMALCRYSGFAMMFFGIGSVAVVFAMSLERFIAIRFGMFYQRSMTTHKTRVFLIIIVVVLLLLSSLPLLGFGEVAQQFPGSWCFLDWKSKNPRHQAFNFLVAFLGIVLMLATVICNLIVVITVSSARSRMRSQNSAHNVLSKRKRRKRAQQENQMMLLLGLMTTVFIVCYLPILLRIVVNQVSSIYIEDFAESNLSSWDLFAVRMASINPIIDPWVYILCRRSVITKTLRILKLMFLCRCDKGELQEICMSSREFKRRKSTMSRTRSASTKSTSLGRSGSSNYKSEKSSPTMKSNESKPLCISKDDLNTENPEKLSTDGRNDEILVRENKEIPTAII